ncbi:MAG: SOS response-associated peptidase family protein, partial [Candidatus Limnocylindrus sp.]
MCGRIVQSSSPEEIAREFGAAIDPVMRGTWQPHWNVAPTATAALIAPHAEVEDANGTVVHERLLTYARWGLVPQWAKDESLVHHGAGGILHRGVRRDERGGCGGRHVAVRMR